MHGNPGGRGPGMMGHQGPPPPPMNNRRYRRGCGCGGCLTPFVFIFVILVMGVMYF